MNEIINMLHGPKGYTVDKIADITLKYIEYKGEKEKWRSQIEALSMAFEKHGRTEMVTLEERRIHAELTRYSIEALVNSGNPDLALEAFREFTAKSPDFLGSVISLIRGTSI